MIEDWCCWVQSVDPKVIVGHNVLGYDFPYLKHCANMHGRELILGCDNSEAKFFRYSSKFRVDGNTEWEYHKINIIGREIIDTMFTSVKYDIGRNYPSWGLKPIVEFHGLVDENRQFYDASKIRQNWQDPIEREKIVQYGIDDSDDSLKLFDIQCPSLFYMNQSVPKSFQEMGTSASGSQLNSMLVRSYLQQGYSIAKTNEREHVSGGISFGVPGNYKNVFKIDIKSMYPSIIRGFKLFPKEKDPNENYLKIANIFTEERFKNKRLNKETGEKYYDDMQAAQKIVINSLYGLMGTSGLNYNNFDLANKITGIARQIIKTTILWATGKEIQHWFPDYDGEKDFLYEDILEIPKIHHNYRISNVDTDSVSICNYKENEITKEQQDQLIDEINGLLPDMIEYEDDGYFDNVLIIKAKNYVLYDGKKMKYKGSSLIDSKKSIVLRELLNLLIDDIMFNGSTLLVDIYHEHIRAVRDCEDVFKWCTKKSISAKVLNPERANESKVLDAVKHLNPREGDKYHLFNIIDGEKPEMKKGEPVILKKTGQVKMVPNRILKVYEEGMSMDDFVFDKQHYYERVYKTVAILENVVDMDQFVKYHLKSNIGKVEEL
jgi:DNA polymerase elongation subunit (family B)